MGGTVSGAAGVETARVVDCVGVRDVTPLGRVVELEIRDERERLVAFEDVDAVVVGRLQVELVDLVVERAVLVDGDREHRAQRRALGAEQLEVLPDVGDDALELGAALVAVLIGEVVARELGAPQERADRRRVRVRVDLHEAVERRRSAS